MIYDKILKWFLDYRVVDMYFMLVIGYFEFEREFMKCVFVRNELYFLIKIVFMLFFKFDESN